MSKRTLDDFLAKSPGVLSISSSPSEEPRNSPPSKPKRAPFSGKKPRSPSVTKTPLTRSRKSTPAARPRPSPSPSLRTDPVIVLDSDDEIVTLTVETKHDVASQPATSLLLASSTTTISISLSCPKMCVVCSEHEILSPLDLCSLCATAFDDNEKDPFITGASSSLIEIPDFAEALIRVPDLGEGDQEEDHADSLPPGNEENVPGTLGQVADFIIPFVTKPAKLLQTTLFSLFGKPEPPIVEKAGKPPLPRRDESGSVQPSSRDRFSYSTSEPTMRHSAPYCKRVPTTSFLIDGFRFKYADPPSPVFFLSHYHSDHYGGLNKNFRRGLIYLNEVTANLVERELGVNSKYLKVLPMRTPTMVENPLGNPVEVTLLDANHCPGSALILFKLSGGTFHLHSGDMRYSSTVPDFEFAARLGIDTLFLDTTYCDPQYQFPTQAKVIEKCLEVMKADIQRSDTIIVVGSYTIGKERLFIAAAQKYNCKIYVDPHKFGIIQCLNFPPEVSALFVRSPQMAKIHVVSMFSLSYQKLQAYVRDLGWPIGRAVGFKPTGWTFTGKEKKNSVDFLTRRQQGNTVVWDVPYSEHSSFNELREFVALVKPKRIVPTVNNSGPEQVNAMISLLTS